MPTSISTRTPGSLNPTRQQLDELDALLKRMLELPVNQLDEGNEPETEEEIAHIAPDLPGVEQPPVSQGVYEPPPPPVEEPVEMEPARPPVSYMVIETASPRPLPPASGFEPRPSPLMPRLAPEMLPLANIAEEEPEGPAETASESETWVPLRSTWQPSAQTWQPLAESWRQAKGTAAVPATLTEPAPSPQFDLTPLLAPPVPEQVETTVREQTIELTQATTEETPVPSTPPAAPSPVAAEPAEPRLSLTAEDAPGEPSWLLPLLWFNQGFDACMSPLGTFGLWLCGPSGRQMLGIAGLACLVAAVAVAVSVGMAWTW